jgi:hypothetical protein
MRRRGFRDHRGLYRLYLDHRRNFRHQPASFSDPVFGPHRSILHPRGGLFQCQELLFLPFPAG